MDNYKRWRSSDPSHGGVETRHYQRPGMVEVQIYNNMFPPSNISRLENEIQKLNCDKAYRNFLVTRPTIFKASKKASRMRLSVRLSTGLSFGINNLKPLRN